MKIKNRERKFLLSVKAANEIAKFCPDNDFNKVTQIADNKTFTEIVEIDLKIAEILINEYEQNQAMENEGYVPDLVSLEDLKDSSLITPLWIKNLEKEIVSVVGRDCYGQILTTETPEAKKNKKNAAAAES